MTLEERMADDHDLLIKLQGQLDALTTVIAANNNASVERDSRIEAKVDRINGTVARHDDDILLLKNRPTMPVTEDEAREIVEHQRELWSVYRIGRWVVGAGILALLGQTVALIALVMQAS